MILIATLVLIIWLNPSTHAVSMTSGMSLRFAGVVMAGSGRTLLCSRPPQQPRQWSQLRSPSFVSLSAGVRMRKMSTVPTSSRSFLHNNNNIYYKSNNEYDRAHRMLIRCSSSSPETSQGDVGQQQQQQQQHEPLLLSPVADCFDPRELARTGEIHRWPVWVDGRVLTPQLVSRQDKYVLVWPYQNPRYYRYALTAYGMDTSTVVRNPHLILAGAILREFSVPATGTSRTTPLPRPYRRASKPSSIRSLMANAVSNDEPVVSSTLFHFEWHHSALRHTLPPSSMTTTTPALPFRDIPVPLTRDMGEHFLKVVMTDRRPTSGPLRAFASLRGVTEWCHEQLGRSTNAAAASSSFLDDPEERQVLATMLASNDQRQRDLSHGPRAPQQVWDKVCRAYLARGRGAHTALYHSLGATLVAIQHGIDFVYDSHSDGSCGLDQDLPVDPLNDPRNTVFPANGDHGEENDHRPLHVSSGGAVAIFEFPEFNSLSKG